jgi:hypothetical protein
MLAARWRARILFLGPGRTVLCGGRCSRRSRAAASPQKVLAEASASRAAPSVAGPMPATTWARTEEDDDEEPVHIYLHGVDEDRVWEVADAYGLGRSLNTIDRLQVGPVRVQ